MYFEKELIKKYLFKKKQYQKSLTKTKRKCS